MHAGHWKFQVPVLARHHRVITVDARGNGRSDRPTDPAAYTVGAIMIAPDIDSLSREPEPNSPGYSFTEELDADDGWALFNQHAWRRDYPRFVDFFWNAVFPEPHSTKAVEDATGWALEISPEVLIATVLAPRWVSSRKELVARIEAIRCPILLVHGTDETIVPARRSEEIAGLTGADLLLLDRHGAGRRMEFAGTDPDEIAAAIVEEMSRPVDYLPVATDGAARAARLLAELL